MFVDTTKGGNYCFELKESVVVDLPGPPRTDPLRGTDARCRFNLMDVVCHTDAIH
jgi:hypothetical protein